MINSRAISDLAPRVATKCYAFIDRCQTDGIRVLITSTYRDKEAQDALYAKGRTAPGNKVTNVAGGRSFHNWRVAFDFVPLDANGNPDWADEDLWQRCGAIGQECGLEWGGAWSGFVDKPHMQDVGGTIAQYQSGEVVEVFG